MSLLRKTLSESPLFRRLLQGVFEALGVLWTLLRIAERFSPVAAQKVTWQGIVLPAFAWAIYRAWPRQRIAIPIPGSDSSCEIKFGNIFDGPGVVVIPVNEYFDGELGELVSPKSLHGKFIENMLGGQSETFYSLISKPLRSVSPRPVDVERPSGRQKRYEIGTFAKVDINGKRYLLVALSHTDLQTLKANATVRDLWTCLEGVWLGARNHSGGEPVKVPLIGSGLSGVGLPPRKLIDITLTSLLCCTKERKVADQVTLVLPERWKYNLDLDEIERHWS